MHEFVQLSTLRILVSAFLFLVRTTVVLLVVKVTEAHPTELVRTIRTIHVLTATLLVDEVATLGTIFRKLGHPFTIFTFQAGLDLPFLHHFTVRRCMRLIATAKAELGVAVSAAHVLVSQ